MSANPVTDDFPQADLIDRIAKALPPDVRAAYYREMMHCRTLPQSDEMLRILYIIQFLVLLIQKAPEMIVTERERIAQLIAQLTELLTKAIRSMEQYQSRLDQRLAQLPEEISNQIRTEAIAAAIAESVRQELLRLGLPYVSEAFETAITDMKKATKETITSNQELRASYRDAADEVRQSNVRMVEANTEAIETIQRKADRLLRKYEWPLRVLIFIGVAFVFFLGTRYEKWWLSPIEPARVVVPEVQPAPSNAVHNAHPKAH